ncbi:hypothetical protein [Roseovarius spongiae]|uniref:hypothetical protein n=1 Tax=Roseovarius spongiae TaxID=2320272 RepID=UPI001408AD96|nr:hypothetical protein [Roseovarius spongiae]
MKTFSLALLICTLAACSNYREPEANCFSFVARGDAPIDCHFDTLGGADFEDLAYE